MTPTPGTPAPPDAQYAELRERYASGAIDLARFEAEVGLLLRMRDALDTSDRPPALTR